MTMVLCHGSADAGQRLRQDLGLVARRDVWANEWSADGRAGVGREADSLRGCERDCRNAPLCVAYSACRPRRPVMPPVVPRWPAADALPSPPGAGESADRRAARGTARARVQRISVRRRRSVEARSPAAALLGDRDASGRHGAHEGASSSLPASARGQRQRAVALHRAYRRPARRGGLDIVIVADRRRRAIRGQIVLHRRHHLVACRRGFGDEVRRHSKAGILEIADLLVGHQGDLPGATQPVRDLEDMLHCAPPRQPSAWRVPVLRTCSPAAATACRARRCSAGARQWPAPVGFCPAGAWLPKFSTEPWLRAGWASSAPATPAASSCEPDATEQHLD